jgi:5-methylcytosine-specific restriction endonuclease McrA
MPPRSANRRSLRSRSRLLRWHNHAAIRQIRAQMLEEQVNRCLYCGRLMILAEKSEYAEQFDFTVTIDHITPISMGGTEDPENLAVVCYQCNQERGDGSFVRMLVNRDGWVDDD